MTKQKICNVADLVENSGVCALAMVGGQEQQIALFYLPTTEKKVYGISNWDPCGEANVLSRGLIGNIGDELVVASPLYKQHFSLTTGRCLEEENVNVKAFNISLEDDTVYIAA